LSKPDAIAINLPEAEPEGGFHDQAFPPGFLRLLWVRQRGEQGLHLRVFFRSAVPAYDIKILEQKVRITFDLKRKAEAHL
jgi:hypothetical protein